MVNITAVGVAVVVGEAGRVMALRVAAGKAPMPICISTLLCIPLSMAMARCQQRLGGLMQHHLAQGQLRL